MSKKVNQSIGEKSLKDRIVFSMAITLGVLACIVALLYVINIINSLTAGFTGLVNIGFEDLVYLVPLPLGIILVCFELYNGISVFMTLKQNNLKRNFKSMFQLVNCALFSLLLIYYETNIHQFMSGLTAQGTLKTGLLIPFVIGVFMLIVSKLISIRVNKESERNICIFGSLISIAFLFYLVCIRQIWKLSVYSILIYVAAIVVFAVSLFLSAFCLYFILKNKPQEEYQPVKCELTKTNRNLYISILGLFVVFFVWVFVADFNMGGAVKLSAVFDISGSLYQMISISEYAGIFMLIPSIYFIIYALIEKRASIHKDIALLVSNALFFVFDLIALVLDVVITLPKKKISESGGELFVIILSLIAIIACIALWIIATKSMKKAGKSSKKSFLLYCIGSLVACVAYIIAVPVAKLPFNYASIAFVLGTIIATVTFFRLPKDELEVQ